MVEIYHPVSGGTADVPAESLHHYRQSGWMTRAEWNELQAQAEQQAQQQQQQAGPQETSEPARPSKAQQAKES